MRCLEHRAKLVLPHKVGVENNCQEKKCLKQLAPNAVKNAKSHSNPTQPDQFTAENALLRNESQGQNEAIKLTA